jgi:hypothetical protein
MDIDRRTSAVPPADLDGDMKVKIALSLYKVQQSIYLLDFQRIEVNTVWTQSHQSFIHHRVNNRYQGDAFGFMKLSALIITELKNLSAASRMQATMPIQPSGNMPSPSKFDSPSVQPR